MSQSTCLLFANLQRFDLGSSYVLCWAVLLHGPYSDKMTLAVTFPQSVAAESKQTHIAVCTVGTDSTSSECVTAQGNERRDHKFCPTFQQANQPAVAVNQTNFSNTGVRKNLRESIWQNCNRDSFDRRVSVGGHGSRGKIKCSNVSGDPLLPIPMSK